jgi:hypothetical protein
MYEYRTLVLNEANGVLYICMGQFREDLGSSIDCSFSQVKSGAIPHGAPATPTPWQPNANNLPYPTFWMVDQTSETMTFCASPLTNGINWFCASTALPK